MNVWFILWFLLSAALLFFAGWTFYIMYRQKESWRAFAKKYKLRYSAKKNFMSPEVSGVVDTMAVSLFTSDHVTQDARAARKMTAIEISLKSQMPFSGAIGSGIMVNIIQARAYKEEIRPAHPQWNTSCILRTSNTAAMEAYLTPERLEALMALMKHKTDSGIFIFEPTENLLRLDTPDPLETLDKLEKLVKKLIKIAQALELKEGEGMRLSVVADKPRGTATKKLDAPDEDSGLQLED